MYTFHALNILIGIIHKPCIEMYWTKNKMLSTPFFASVMTYNTFCHLTTLLHFAENDPTNQTDKLWKIRPVYELINESFQAVYRPGENISIDESLVPWKGRLQFRQCNRNKRARFGVKIYKNCESETGYVYNLSVYAGKDLENKTVNKGIGISGLVVKNLLGDLAGQGRSLFIDNWYSSPLLFKQLVDEKTHVCGTVRENRKYLPKIDARSLNVGDMKVIYTPKMAFMAWKDKKVVRMLTTMHNPTMIGTNKQNRVTKEEIMKPNVVVSYNKNMGGVDKTDQSISSYETIHKTVKWYHKLYFHLFDTAIYNAFVVYKHLQTDANTINHLQFRQTLATELLEEHSVTPITSKQRCSASKISAPFPQNHYPSYISNNSKENRKRCSHCHSNKKRKDTYYMCKACKVPLYVVPCFEKYHKK